VLLDIIAEHVEEVEILWSRRRAAAWSPGLSLRGLETLDDRLNAHLDAVALGVRASEGTLAEALRGRDADAAFAAAAALLTTRDPRARRGVTEALTGAPPEACRGIAEALCHLPPAVDALVSLNQRLERTGSLDPIAIEVLSFHRALAPEALAPAVTAGSPVTRRAAARAFGRVGGEAGWIERLADDHDREVRDAAFEAAARRGLTWVLPGLREVCGDPARVSAEALRLLSRLGERSDIGRLEAVAREESLGEPAIAGLATLGYPECVDAVVEAACDARLARAAGRAFARITGIEPPVKGGDALAAEVEDATFEDLRPTADGDAMRGLWCERAADFDPGRRWRNGKPLAPGRWREAPHRGDLLTRREELTRLWLREPTLFTALEPDAPASRQRAAA